MNTELIEKEIIEYICCSIGSDLENGWWEVYKRSCNEIIPLDDLIMQILNSNELSEHIVNHFEDDFDVDFEEIDLNKFIENTIENNLDKIKSVYNKQIKN